MVNHQKHHSQILVDFKMAYQLKKNCFSILHKNNLGKQSKFDVLNMNNLDQILSKYSKFLFLYFSHSDESSLIFEENSYVGWPYFPLDLTKLFK